MVARGSTREMTERKEQGMKKSLSHTVWECTCHIVWVPKNRRKIIYGKLRKELGQILRWLCEYKGVEAVGLGGRPSIIK